jgi:hypothetical protein
MPRAYPSQLAWLSRIRIAMISGRINQNWRLSSRFHQSTYSDRYSEFILYRRLEYELLILCRLSYSLSKFNAESTRVYFYYQKEYLKFVEKLFYLFILIYILQYIGLYICSLNLFHGLHFPNCCRAYSFSSIVYIFGLFDEEIQVAATTKIIAFLSTDNFCDRILLEAL